MNCIDHGKVRGVHKFGYAYKKRAGLKQLMHRLVYADANGVPIEALLGVVIRHSCDNARCINPAHLIAGTYADNGRDKAERGRATKGEAIAISVLKSADVQAIRACFISGDRHFGARALARKYNTTHRTILLCVKHTTWKEVA